jgi:hypothetical protein
VWLRGVCRGGDRIVNRGQGGVEIVVRDDGGVFGRCRQFGRHFLSRFYRGNGHILGLGLGIRRQKAQPDKQRAEWQCETGRGDRNNRALEICGNRMPRAIYTSGALNLRKKSMWKVGDVSEFGQPVRITPQGPEFRGLSFHLNRNSHAFLEGKCYASYHARYRYIRGI